MQPVDDTQGAVAATENYSDYYRQGWELHVKGEQDAAEASIRKALAFEPESVDARYLLGLILKVQGRAKEAAATFEGVVELLDHHLVEDRTRSSMLRRLAKGHIHHLKTGDWNLEKEIWQRKGEEAK